MTLTIQNIVDLLTLMTKQDSQDTNSDQTKRYNGKYVIVRTFSAGVFAGEIQSRNGREVILHNARRIWKWSGAASLSQLAMEGTSDPENCMFPCEVAYVELLEAIEILDCTEKAKASIKAVKIWKA